jgi:lysozyme
MNENPIKLGRDDVLKIEGPSGQTAAADGLRQEYVADIVITPNQRRRNEERAAFRDRFEQQNVNLDPIKKGWGPFQVLQEMVKDHRIDLSQEQLLQEARRIRDRDFASTGRNFYSAGEKTSFWSQEELNKKVDDTVSRVKGIDVYHGNGDIDWKKVGAAGYQFAFLKASEGITVADDHLETNRREAQEAGLRVGYYHFFRPNDSVEEQVKNFVTAVGKPDANALRLVVDLEIPKIWKPYGVKERVKMIEDWCEGVRKELGTTPSIAVYGSPNFFSEILQNAPELAKYDLWIADYRGGEPQVPKPWSNWTFFQYSEHGKVPGITTEVDLDMYIGTDLDKAMGAKTGK